MNLRPVQSASQFHLLQIGSRSPVSKLSLHVSDGPLCTDSKRPITLIGNMLPLTIIQKHEETPSLHSVIIQCYKSLYLTKIKKSYSLRKCLIKRLETVYDLLLELQIKKRRNTLLNQYKVMISKQLNRSHPSKIFNFIQSLFYKKMKHHEDPLVNLNEQLRQLNLLLEN